jgi:flagellar hook-associated protein 3 FlgL
MRRVSENQRFAATAERMSVARNQVDRIQEQAVSGRQLHNVSDDPVAVVRALRNRTQLAGIDQYRKTLDFARGFLSITEDALRSMNESVIRAKELAVQQANATYDEASRKVVAQEIRQIEEHIVNLGNSTYNDRYVFGGYQTYRPPVSPDGTYLGDDGVIFVQVNQDSFKPINISGREVFGESTSEYGARAPLLSTIRGLAEALEDNDLNGVHKRMSELDKASETIVNTLATVGSRSTAIEDVTQRLDFSEERLVQDNTRIEGADPAKTALELKRAESALEYTLNSSARILPPSLLTYLK